MKRLKTILGRIKAFFIHGVVRSSLSDKPVLFIDGNGHDCYKDDVIYYVALDGGGTYKTGWDFAEEISKSLVTWNILISIGLIKGLYKNKEKAEEYCFDAKAGAVKETGKAFLKNLGV